MAAERGVRAFWPVWTVLFLAVSPLMFGWQDSLPVLAVWIMGCAVVIALAYTLVKGIKAFDYPTEAEAIARVDSRLAGRPITTLADQQAIGTGDAASEAVWQVHIARMRDRTKAARYVAPDLRVAASDPYGLRLIAVLFFTVALLFGSFGRVSVVEVPQVGDVVAVGPTWEGWIEPPSYTGKPTLYLADIPGDRLTVPVGSQITLRFYGDVGALTLAETVSGRTDDVPPASDLQHVFEVTRDGEIAINGQGGKAWGVVIAPDTAPTVEITGPATSDAAGLMTMPFRAQDDFGVMAGGATFTLDLSKVERRHGLAVEPDTQPQVAVDLPMPVTGSRTDFDNALVDDFSQDMLANMPVIATFTASDAIRQEGTSAPVEMVLPGRRFFQPVAKSVIELRRDLMWSKANAPRTLRLLRAVTYRPEGFIDDETMYLRLRFILTQLEGMTEDGLTDDEVIEIAKAMWDVAVQFEEGTLANARARLERAQERLAEAMRNGASPEEIQELMDELRDATKDYMQMLADQQDPQMQTDQPQSNEDTFEFTQDELNNLMDEIQKLMEEGRMAEAAELMERLNELMENMQISQGQGQGEGPRTPGQQSMEDLGETLRDQQELSDDAFRDFQRQFNQGQPQDQQGQQGQEQGQQQGQQGQGEQQGQGGQDQNGQGGEQSLADRQQALRDMLEEQRRNLPNLGGDEADQAERNLDEAGRAMDRAEDALRNGNTGEAIDNQAQALDALREGLRNLGRALAQNDQNGDQQQAQGEQEGGAQGQRGQSQQRDPLGRRIGNSDAQASTDKEMLQDEIYRRAGELLDEIRRRAGEQERPEEERDYLRRLLDQF